MSDPIPANIYQRIKEWLAERRPCQIQLNISPDGRIVSADRVLKDHVTAQ